MRILHISYDGMTDPLGQSQVLPYLFGLAALGHEISLLSAEKPEAFEQLKSHIEKQTLAHGVSWHPIPYTATPPVLSTIKDVRALKRKALELHKQKPFEALHCRSYIAALTGLFFKQKLGIPFVFDMRGFWADERVDGKLWKLSNPLYRTIYNYFKRKEKKFFEQSAAIVSLTEKGQDIISHQLVPRTHAPITVIPCCVDTALFCKETIEKQDIQNIKSALGIKDTDRILTYLGSLGTWYMPDEMMAFYKVLLTLRDDFKFLFITPDKPEDIHSLAAKHGVSPERIIITKARREEVPKLLSLTDISLFFIKPVFSKQASSPTKQAEVLSMGIPIICNDSIGDTSDIILSNKVGLVVKEFTTEAYSKAIGDIDRLLDMSPSPIREVALKHFSLEKGVMSYHSIYQNINDGKK